MAGEWLECSLGDLVSLQRGHDLPEGARVPGKVPVVGSFGVTGSHNVARAHGPGVTIGRSGSSFGTTNFVDEDYWPLNTCMYVTDFKGNDPKFCYYLISTLNFAGFNSGSAQPSLNRNYIYPMPLRVPDKGEQKRIGELLSTLDEKIDLNRKMVETLEAMGRTLFKSWFVNFDPVNAKAEGRPTGLSDNLAALFPARFGVDGLPEGWRLGSVGELLNNVVSRERPSPKTASQPYVPIDSILSRCLSSVNERPGLDAQSSLVSFSQDDILFGAMRPYFHKVCIAPFSGTTRTTVFVLRPIIKADLMFCLFLLSEDSTVDYATASSSGSTIPYAVWENGLANYNVVIPSREIRNIFNETTSGLIKKAQSVSAQSKSLAAIRDALLPKLISGDLRIRDAENSVAAA